MQRMLHFLLFIFILFYYRRNVIGHAQKFSCVSTSVPHTEWNSSEQCYNVLHHDRSPAFLNSCWFLICEHIIKSEKSFGNRVKNIFFFHFFSMKYSELWWKMEENRENGRKYRWISCRLISIRTYNIGVYIISVDISFTNLAYFGCFGALMYHIWYG